MGSTLVTPLVTPGHVPDWSGVHDCVLNVMALQRNSNATWL